MFFAHLYTPIGFIKLSFDKKFVLLKIAKSTPPKDSKSEEYPNSVKFLIESIENYFTGRLLKIEYPVNLKGLSKFDRKVLDFIMKIPYGKTVTYKFIAEELHTSPRAIGQALHRNPFPLIIPCHRIVKSDGTLGGYSLGLEAKKWLLEHERTILYKLLSHKILPFYGY